MSRALQLGAGLAIAVYIAARVTVFASIQPAVIQAQVGAAAVEIAADNVHLLLDNQCLVLHWRLNNIQSVMLNGAAVVSEGQQSVCAADAVFLVAFQDGGEATYAVKRQVLFDLEQVAYLAVVVSFALLMHYGPDERGLVRRGVWKKTLALVAAGTLIRALLAISTAGNFDMQSYQIVLDILHRGGSVYAETNRYNYTPVWFTLLYAVDSARSVTPLSMAAAIRIFLTGVDLMTLLVLIAMGRRHGQSPVRMTALFYLNPLSYLITGYHGQFENLAILPILVGLWAYGELAATEARKRTAALWLGATVGMIVKHIVFYQLLIELNFSVRRFSTRILLIGAGFVVFGLTFLPFLPVGLPGIVNNVLRYVPVSTDYGLTLLFNASATLRNLFIVALLLYPFFQRSPDLILRSLQGFLFFVTFAPAMANEYMLLPLALGALRPSAGFYLYTLCATVSVLGSDTNLHLAGMRDFSWNLVWLAAGFWLLTTHFQLRLSRRSAARAAV